MNFKTVCSLAMLPLFWLCVSSIAVSEESVTEPILEMEAAFASSGYCLDEHNAARRAAGKGPFNYDQRLATAAQWHSNTMHSQNCFSHRCPGETDFGDRVQQAGYTNFRGIAENIAGGVDNCQDAVNAWMCSDGHRANILGNLDNIGCASTGKYWTCNFG